MIVCSAYASNERLLQRCLEIPGNERQGAWRREQTVSSLLDSIDGVWGKDTRAIMTSGRLVCGCRLVCRFGSNQYLLSLGRIRKEMSRSCRLVDQQCPPRPCLSTAGP